MADIEKLRANLEKRGFSTSCFETAQQAADYLNTQIDDAFVAFGGSVTLQEMGLYDKLASHNRAVWHWANGTLPEADGAQVYVTSVNGVAETGELINIDGTGNRVAATIYGRKKVYFVIGVNKIAPDYDAALWRARNIASPKNAQRLNRKTPCALKGDRCYDCASPERICRALVVLWEKPHGVGQAEVVIVNQELGY